MTLFGKIATLLREVLMNPYLKKITLFNGETSII